MDPTSTVPLSMAMRTTPSIITMDMRGPFLGSEDRRSQHELLEKHLTDPYTQVPEKKGLKTHKKLEYVDSYTLFMDSENVFQNGNSP